MTTSAPDSSSYYPAAPTGLVRPAIFAGVATVVVTVVALLVGHIWFAAFFLAGVVLVFINTKLVIRAVDNVATAENPRKKLLALNSAYRLGAITVLALVAAFLVRPDGLGAMFGLAVGQVILVLNTVIPVMKGLRKQP